MDVETTVFNAPSPRSVVFIVPQSLSSVIKGTQPKQLYLEHRQFSRLALRQKTQPFANALSLASVTVVQQKRSETSGRLQVLR